MNNHWQELDHLIQEESIAGVTMKTYKIRPRNLNETLEKSVERFPEKIALVHEEMKLTYQEMQEQVNNIAYQLRHRYGVKKGDRIALLLMNGIPFAVSVYAILKLGAIAVPLNTKLKSTELEYMIMHSGAKIIIANRDWWPNIEPIIENTWIEQIFITESDLPNGTIPFSQLVDTPALSEVTETVDEFDPAFIMFTSGTTGRPKGALINHFNMIHTILNYQYCYKLTPNDATVIAVPVFHITGLGAQLMPFIHLGGKVVLLSKFNPKEFLEIVEREEITSLMGAPTIYVMSLLEPDYKKYNVSHVRVAGFGGAPMPSDTLKALNDWIPSIELHNTYGLTETTSPAIIMPDQLQMEEVSAVGAVVPTGEVKVVDPESGRLLGPGEVGELLFKGPMVIFEYWNNKEATEKAIKDGWFSTGDLGVMSSSGIITIMDRIKDMINRGGEKIYSVEVEDVLYANPKVMEAAIVGVPDPIYGEAVKACVVPRRGEQLTEEEVKEWVRDRLAKYKVPAYVEFMVLLPRNPNGKVMKTELRYIPNVSQK